MSLTKISAVIITFNEARNIGRCLQSLQGVADEIIVVDSGSTDATIEIAKKYNVIVVSQPWLGYGTQKNLGNSKASHPYILSLDADEALNEQLAEHILKEKAIGLKNAYRLYRLNNHYGNFIKYNYERKVRLFPTGKAYWNNDIVHESLILEDGMIINNLNGYLLHYTFYSLEEHLQQSNKYSTLSAQLYYSQGKKASIANIIFSPVATFLQAYFLKRGFMNGTAGFVAASMSAYNKFEKYTKLWLLYKKKCSQ